MSIFRFPFYMCRSGLNVPGGSVCAPFRLWDVVTVFIYLALFLVCVSLIVVSALYDLPR